MIREKKNPWQDSFLEEYKEATIYENLTKFHFNDTDNKAKTD